MVYLNVPTKITKIGCTRPQYLIIYDRGYPSFQLIFEHYRRNIDFAIRSEKDFNKEITAFYQNGSTSKT